MGCTCGCNTCHVSPLLNEAKQYDAPISENLRYHINKKIPLNESIFRAGSNAHVNLLQEARNLWNQGIIEFQLTEAEKKKKNPPLGKPKRGGSKKFYVYVRDPKTKNIKKVSFGQVGMSAKINDPKARQAFAKRHKCAQKTDKTKPSYWSCRLPRYAKLLGLKSTFSGFW